MRNFFLIFWLLPKLLFGIQGESSFPYLSGYTWAFFCDWRMLGEDYKSGAESFLPEDVKLGDTIFLDFTRVEEFAREVLPKIKDKVILITGNYGWSADRPIPGRFGYLLDEEKIAAWFVQNIDRDSSEKLIPIPIGIASKHWEHGDTLLLNQWIPQSFMKKQKSIFCYLNYAERDARAKCTAHFKKMGAKFTTAKTFAEYLEDLSESVFVVSPPGAGLDCHRTWEALLMGCYPIVESNTLDPLYEGLPVVIINDWSEVTQEFLEEKYLELSNQLWSQDKLYAHYWFKKVKDIQNKLRKEK